MQLRREYVDGIASFDANNLTLCKGHSRPTFYVLANRGGPVSGTLAAPEGIPLQ